MDYIKFYIKMHVKNWPWYLLSIFLLMPAWVSLMVGFFLGLLGVPEVVIFIVDLVLGGFILSVPVLYVNYMIAKKHLENNKLGNIIKLTVVNHVVTHIIYAIIFFFVVNL